MSLKNTQEMYQLAARTEWPVMHLWAVVAVAHVVDIVSLLVVIQSVAHWILSGWHDWCGCSRRWWVHGEWRCAGCFLRSVHVRLLLCLANVLLVANALVTEPIANLRDLWIKKGHTCLNTIQFQWILNWKYMGKSSFLRQENITRHLNGIWIMDFIVAFN